MQKLKRNRALSTISQVLYKYLDDADNTIKLPEAANDSTQQPSDSSGSGESGGGSGGSGGGTEDGGEMGE